MRATTLPGDWTPKSEKAFGAAADAGRITSELLLDARLVDTLDEIVEYLEMDRSLWVETVRRVNNDPTTSCEYWRARVIRDLAGDDMSVAW